MRINNINTQVNLTTRRNQEQITFNGKLVNVAKTIIRKKIRAKMPLVSGIEVNDLQKLQKMQAEEVNAELPTATTKLKDRTEPIKWEVRENISGQPLNEDKENQETTSTKKSTNLLDLIG